MINIDKLNDLVLDKYVVVKKHPTADLYLYNYTQKTQFEKKWNDLTLMCRGLILSNDAEIKARPFVKFFNYQELDSSTIPKESYEVFEKMDGSLGISYWIDEQPFIATRGSFESDQAIIASDWLSSKYASAVKKMDKSITYLFEIIYPDNRIVVDYNGRSELVLIGCVETSSGKELPLVDIGFPLVKKYSSTLSIVDMMNTTEANREGYVLKYKSGLRVKIKLEDYVRIHRLVTQISTYTIWESLLNHEDIEKILVDVPDEFFEWVKIKIAELKLDYKKVLDVSKKEFRVLDSRKATAELFLKCSYPKVMFALLDNKPLEPIIWKIVKPKYDRPFVTNREK